MKNFLTLSILLSLTVMSCEKGKSTTETSTEMGEQMTTKTDKLPVDSIKVEDSLKVDKNLTVNFESKLLVFPTLKNKSILDSIYGSNQIHLDEYSKANLAESLKKKQSEFYDQQKEALTNWKPEFAQNWYSNSNMKMISNDNDFLTIQYTQDGYTGGAHGYYNEFYKVFDLKNNKTVQLSEIITNKDSALWQPILMDNFIKNDAGKGQAEMLLVKEIPINDNFYFDKENLYFLYNQYEITAYAAGPVLIKIPLSDIKPLLTDDFLKRQNL